MNLYNNFIYWLICNTPIQQYLYKNDHKETIILGRYVRLQYSNIILFYKLISSKNKLVPN